MADLSKIKLNGIEYDLKDAYARENIPNKINDLTDKMFGIAWLDNNNTNGYIYCNNVNFSYTGSSDFSSPFLFMVKKTAEHYGNVTLLHSGNFTLYDINDNFSYGVPVSSINIYPNTEKLQYGKFYIGYLSDGILNLYPLARQQDVNSAIATAISNINQFEVAIVTDLPTSNIDTHTIYFKSNSSSGNNVYDEYMYINNNWELIGSTAVDLSNYVEESKSDDSNGSHIVNNGFGQVYLTTVAERSNQAKIDLKGSNLKLKSWTGAAPTAENNANTITLTPTQTTIKNIINPTEDGDAANKKYVDDSVSAISIPTKTSDLTNDSGYITSYTETDPTVPSWAKAANKPSYTASEVGALASNTTYVSTFNGQSGAVTYTAPVTSVNNQTGAVTLSIPTAPGDIGAAASSHAHGNITSGGDMTATAAIASGDRLVINDESASKLVSSTITFGSSTTQYLANNGTWQNAYDDTALAARVTALEQIPWVTYYTGSSTPSNSQGNNGDLYFQTSQ